MAVFKFNKEYRDKELKRSVKANEPVEMTIKRADEIVKNIRKQSDKFQGYEEFEYERIDNKEQPADENPEENQSENEKPNEEPEGDE